MGSPAGREGLAEEGRACRAEARPTVRAGSGLPVPRPPFERFALRVSGKGRPPPEADRWLNGRACLKGAPGREHLAPTPGCHRVGRAASLTVAPLVPYPPSIGGQAKGGQALPESRASHDSPLREELGESISPLRRMREDFVALDSG
jgi:hypothetical protein